MQKIIIYKQKLEKDKSLIEFDVDAIMSEIQDKYREETITFIAERLTMQDEHIYLPFRVQSKRTVRGF